MNKFEHAALNCKYRDIELPICRERDKYRDCDRPLCCGYCPTVMYCESICPTIKNEKEA